MNGTTKNLGDISRYEIRIQGHLDQRWSMRFEGLLLRPQADGTTVLDGVDADQAALHGLLQRIRDLGLPLISVTQIDRRNDATRRADPARHSDPSQGDDE